MKETVMSKVAIIAIGLVLCGEGAMAQNTSGPGPMGACAADRATYCKGVQPGQGRIVDCLAAHQAQLTATCKEQMGPIFKRRQQGNMHAPAGGSPMETHAPATGTQKNPPGSQSPG